MRCCFVIQHIGALGGTERAATGVLNGLAARGADLHLLEVAPVGPPLFPLDPRVVCHGFARGRVSLVRAWPQLVRWVRAYVRAHAIDVVVVVEATHALYAVPALAGTGVRVVVWEHFNFRADMGRRKRRLGRWMAGRWADHVVTLTQRDVGLWQAGMRVRADIRAIPNSAPPPLTTPYPQDARLVLAVGRLAAQKGFDRLIAVWGDIARAPQAQGWRLAIVGDGPDRAALQRQIDGAGLGDTVTLVPATTQIAGLYAQAALYACTSRFEGLPMVLLEAAAWGVPVVSVDCETGPSDIIVPGESGVLVPQDDWRGFGAALLALMGDDALRAHLSAGARHRALAFSTDRVIGQWVALLGGPV